MNFNRLVVIDLLSKERKFALYPTNVCAKRFLDRYMVFIEYLRCVMAALSGDF